MKEKTVSELKSMMDSGADFQLIDVREPHEFKYANITHSVLIPLNQIPNRINELNKDDEIVVICHHGMRSQQAANYLVQSGFKNIANLTGGIDDWSCNADSSVRRY